MRISKNHGVNPTICKCFFCGKDTGEIALLGLLPGDKEAPKYSVLNKEPCPACKEDFSKGFTIFEAEANGEPNGNVWVIQNEAAKEIFPAYAYEAGRCKITRKTAIEIGLYVETNE